MCVCVCVCVRMHVYVCTYISIAKMNFRLKTCTMYHIYVSAYTRNGLKSTVTMYTAYFYATMLSLAKSFESWLLVSSSPTLTSIPLQCLGRTSEEYTQWLFREQSWGGKN